MRVLYYIPGNVFGGAHNQCLQLASELAGRGYEAVALLPAEPGDGAQRLEAAGVEVHQLELTRIRATRSPVHLLQHAHGVRSQVSTLTAFLAREGIGMVQLHGLLALDGAAAARRAGLPVVWQLIDTRPPRWLRRLLTPVVNRRADAVMTTGTRLLSEYPGLTRDPRRHVPFFPPVRGDQFLDARASGARAEARRALLGGDAGPDTLVVGSLGNLNPQKGFEYLIDAVASLRGARPALRLVVRGAPSPGHPDYRRSLMAALDRHGFPPDTVAALPPDMSVPQYMSALDVFALTPVRRSEGVPTVLLEAMWAGLPCIATDVGGVADVISDDVGALCTPESVSDIAGAVARVVDAPPDQRRLMSDQAQRAARERFTIDDCTDAHVVAYEAARRNRASRGWD